MKNICIVGCGGISHSHAKNLSKRAHLYFHSIPGENAEKFKKKYNGVKAFENFYDMLKTEEIDALIIASPPEFHKEQILKGLKYKKSILVEKPMCISEKEVREIETALKKAGNDVFLMVAENYYYKPSLLKIKELIREGHIGKMKYVSVKKAFTQNSGSWRTRYGSLLEGGIHFVALLSDIVDKKYVKITADFPGYEEGKSERSSVLEIKYTDGIEGHLIYAWNRKSLPGGVLQKSYVLGDKGKITFESNGIYVNIDSEKLKKTFFPNLLDLTGVKRMTEDFLACLEDKKRRPYSDFERAKRDLAIVFEAYESSGIRPVSSEQ